MNEQLQRALDDELSMITATPDALRAIRRATRKPRRRRWPIAVAAAVPVAAIAVVVAVVAGSGDQASRLGPDLPGSTPTQGGAAPSAGAATPSGGPSASSPPSAPGVAATPAVVTSVGSRRVTLPGGDGTTTQATIPLLAGSADDPRLGWLNTAIQTAAQAVVAVPDAQDTFTGTLTSQVVLRTTRVVAVYFSAELDTAGAAHPSDFVGTVTLSLATGEAVPVSAYFTDAKAAFTAIGANAKSQLTPTITDFQDSGIAPTAANFQYLTPTAGGLRVDFAYYQVGSRPDGAPTAIVPWSVVDPYLTAATKALFGR